MPEALPFILFCLAFLVIGYLRAPRRTEPLPSLGRLGLRLLRIQALGIAAALLIAPFAGSDVAVAVFLGAQALAALELLVQGLNVLLARG